MINLMLYLLMGAYALLGVWSRDFGLRTRMEMYVYAFLHGANLGPLLSYARGR